MTDKFDLLRRRKELILERNARVSEIKNKYQQKIEAINDRITSMKEPPPPPAIERYIEPEDAPARFCAGCGEPLLRATVQNAEDLRIVTAYMTGGFQPPVQWTHLRAMRKEFCCACCRAEPSKGHHSCQCMSATQYALRRNEMNEDDHQPMTAAESLLFMPLDGSRLCPDCSMVGNDPHRCPSCANEHGLMNLGAVLNREQAPTEDESLRSDVPFGIG